MKRGAEDRGGMFLIRPSDERMRHQRKRGEKKEILTRVNFKRSLSGDVFVCLSGYEGDRFYFLKNVMSQ